MINVFAKFVKAVINTLNDVNYISLSFTNIKAVGYTLDNITICNEYGSGSYPTGQLKGILIPTADYTKSFLSIGFMQPIPPSKYTPSEGDSWKFSSKYITAQEVNGVRCYRINDDNYSATLISGEWVNKIQKDIINEIQSNLTTFINNKISIAITTHVHTGGTLSGGLTGVAQTIPDVIPIPSYTPDSSLQNDFSAINNGSTLIADGGNNPNA